MNADKGDATGLNAITERVIGCAITVANTLGVGFAEKVYQNALAHEMHLNGLIPARLRPGSCLNRNGPACPDHLSRPAFAEAATRRQACLRRSGYAQAGTVRL